jgi:hypothetical protein
MPTSRSAGAERCGRLFATQLSKALQINNLQPIQVDESRGSRLESPEIVVGPEDVEIGKSCCSGIAQWR